MFSRRVKAEQLLRKAIAAKRPVLVVTNATLASQVARRVLEGSGTPMIFMTVSDPVGAGLIREIGVSTGTFVTGRVHTIDARRFILPAVPGSAFEPFG